MAEKKSLLKKILVPWGKRSNLLRLTSYLLITLFVGILCEIFSAIFSLSLSWNKEGPHFLFLQTFTQLQDLILFFLALLCAQGLIIFFATFDVKKHSSLKVSSGCNQYHILTSHDNEVTQVKWATDGQTLASSTYDGTLRIWDTQTGKIRHILNRTGGTISSISPQGDTLVTSSQEEDAISFWDIRTGEKLSDSIRYAHLATHILWSPDGTFLTILFKHGTIRCLDTETREQVFSAPSSKQATTWQTLVAWSPDSQLLAFITSDPAGIALWNRKLCQETVFASSEMEEEYINLAWSPDGQALATVSRTQPDHICALKVWDREKQSLRYKFDTRNSQIRHLLWSPDSTLLAASTEDNSIYIWDMVIGREQNRLQDFTDNMKSLAFSHDGRLLAALVVPLASYAETGSYHDRYTYQDQHFGRYTYYDGSCHIWRTDTWDKVATMEGIGDPDQDSWYMAFHPTQPYLATPGHRKKDVIIWQLDYDILLRAGYSIDTVRYTNAKVVLVGDSGVGKSGLGLVLTGEKFRPTESTHGRHIWRLETQHVELANGQRAHGEILLWDLAGQPGYRLIHQLHLNEVTVALVVFDGKHPTDPFAGIEYWDRALRQSRQVQGTTALPLTKFLVAARNDRGGIGVSPERIQALVQKMGFAETFVTSAKQGEHIAELRTAIIAAIDWQQLPVVNSTELFQTIKTFLQDQEHKGHVIATVNELYEKFQDEQPKEDQRKERRLDFDTCIGRLAAAGSLQRFSFGNLVLLQPELLDAYASALINTVRDEPDSLGFISEQRVRQGDFTLPKDERIASQAHEALLLIAMIEDLLRRDLVLREGEHLVFPSETTRANPDLPQINIDTIIFTFEGPLQNIYSTLAVRLANSGLFQKHALWKNAITFHASAGGSCGLFLRHIDEGRGEFTLFFDQDASEQTRFHFECYVRVHLNRYALPESIVRQRCYVCPTPSCKLPISTDIVQRARERNMHVILCPICHTSISLEDHEERLTRASVQVVGQIDTSAEQQREYEAAQSTLEGKRATKDFDVFLCYNSMDRPLVKQIGEQLLERGLLPWLDEWELQPGLPWLAELERSMMQIKAAAVFVGRRPTSPWQKAEIAALLHEFVHRGCPVIPILLKDALQEPQLPLFLQNHTWVDFRQSDPDPLERLIWGITGRRPRASK